MSLVSCAWLKQQLDEKNPNIRVVDGVWHQPAWKRDAQKEFEEGHVSGAVRFSISDISDKESAYALMLPPAAQFGEAVGKMGIGNDTHVVIYDNNAKFGFYSAGRVWWMFKVFGHEKVSILDGGLPKWLKDGYPVVAGPQGEVTVCTYSANYNGSLVRSYEEMLANHSSKKEQVVDARPKARFEGTAPEPNPRLNSGSILGTTNVPFTMMVNPDTLTLKDNAALEKVFEEAGVDLSKPAVLTCGGAMVAPLLYFATFQLGKQLPVYDGSWGEWVQRAPADTMKLGVKGEDM